ncbi:MAG: energy transducer TonB [Polyangiaceae bacterium]|nr:energy transducer TonB [Polyangiaceae bacterium]
MLEQRAIEAGDMTAAMRAVDPRSSERAVRLCEVRAGAIVEERLFRGARPVTIGPSGRASFTVSHPALGRDFRLVERRGRDFFLALLPEMTGSVAVGERAVDLDTLRAHAERVRVGHRVVHRVALGERARGRLVLGDTTLLFQLVVPAPGPRPAALAPALRRDLVSDVDWTTTIVAAGSFLLHFGAVALVYSDWLDPVADDEIRATQLLESLPAPPAPPVELPARADEASAATAPAGVARAVPADRSRGSVAPSRTPGGARGGRTREAGEAPGARGRDASRVAELAADLEALDVRTVGAFGSQGPHTEVVLEDGETPVGAVDTAARSGSAAGPAAAGLHLAQGGPAKVTPGRHGLDDLTEVGDRGAHGDESGGVAVGSARAPDGPRIDVAAGAQQQAGGEVKNAPGVIARLRGQFRRCYEGGFGASPDLEGSVMLTVRVGPNGEVQSVSGGGGPLAPIVPCLSGVLQSAVFSAPQDHQPAVLLVPFVFKRQS